MDAIHRHPVARHLLRLYLRYGANVCGRAQGRGYPRAAQGLHAIVTLGAGMFVGTWFAGLVAQVYTEGDQHDWQPIWLIPAAMGTVLFFVFALFFKDDRHVRGAAVESGT
ncbi:MAG: hypothetical protein R3C56_07605 [Pirellulaceae bacterium]